jgi:hypothetical protein
MRHSTDRSRQAGNCDTGSRNFAKVQAGHDSVGLVSWLLRCSSFLHREARYSHSDACSRYRWHSTVFRLGRNSYCDRCFGLEADRLHHCSYRQYEGQGRPPDREVVGRVAPEQPFTTPSGPSKTGGLLFTATQTNDEASLPCFTSCSRCIQRR